MADAATFPKQDSPVFRATQDPRALRLDRRRTKAYVLPYANQTPGSIMIERHASLFRNGRNQAVRIPREFELEGAEVLIRKEGDSLILTPIRKNRLLDLLASWAPLDEGLPEVEDLPPQERADF